MKKVLLVLFASIAVVFATENSSLTPDTKKFSTKNSMTLAEASQGLLISLGKYIENPSETNRLGYLKNQQEYFDLVAKAGENVDSTSAEEAAVAIHLAGISGEALKLDGILSQKKADEKCSLLFDKAGVEDAIKSKMVEICVDVASGKENYFATKQKTTLEKLRSYYNKNKPMNNPVSEGIVQGFNRGL